MIGTKPKGRIWELLAICLNDQRFIETGKI